VGIQHLGSGYGCSEHQRRQPGELHLRSGRNGESGTNLTITGTKGAGTSTISAPTVISGMAVGSAGPPTGYVAALDSQISAQESPGSQLTTLAAF